VIEEASALYAVAPAEFIAERNRVVKALKAEGRADDAAVVAALRKPRVSEHGLNLASRHDAGLARRFAEAAAAATAAQAAAIGGGGADALRDANRALRSASVELIDAAVAQLSENGRGGAAQRDEIEEVVRSLTSSSGRDLLVAGVLGSASVDADELFAGAPTGGGSPPARAPAERKRPEPSKGPGRQATERGARRVGTTPDEERARADAAETRADAAETRADAARRRRLEADRTRAKAALRAAEADRTAAERELEALRSRLADAERRVSDAEAALGAADDAVDAARADLAKLDDSE